MLLNMNKKLLENDENELEKSGLNKEFLHHHHSMKKC